MILGRIVDNMNMAIANTLDMEGAMLCMFNWWFW
jgi:hypothetical protein